jgi:hypothetical protein
MNGKTIGFGFESHSNGVSSAFPNGTRRRERFGQRINLSSDGVFAVARQDPHRSRR